MQLNVAWAGAVSTPPTRSREYQKTAEWVGFEPTVRITAQRVSSSKILMVHRHTVAKRVRQFVISAATLPACDPQYRPVPRGSFAISFAKETAFLGTSGSVALAH